jgi:hypothetical protein
MKVATIEEAIEGAPTLIESDGEGGVTFTLITDEEILVVVNRICDENDWSPSSRAGLYQAICEVLSLLPEGGE